MMNFKKFLFSALFVGLTAITFAGPGDTITIQTMDFNIPVLPGWNAPRSGTYLFPPDSISFSKILISYTLKYDPDQNPHCGEWDYITYLKYIEHTGEYDSNLYFHSNYLVNNQSPDSFPYMNDTSWRYQPVLEYFNNTNPTYEAETGSGTSTMTLPLEDTTPDGRFQAIYYASVLQASGIQSGQITGVKIHVLSESVSLHHFTLKMRNISGELNTDSIQSSGFQSVFSRNTTLINGWSNKSIY